MNRTVKVVVWLVVIILIVWVVAAGDKKSPASTEPVRIGGAYILSGPASLVGELQMNATKMAVDEINAAGGINGRTLEVITEDAQYESKTALNAYQALKQKGLRFIIADGSPVAMPIRSMVVSDGNFMIVPGATAPAYFDGENRTCRIALTARNFAPAMADLMAKRGYKKVALFLPDNEYGRGFTEEFSKVLPQKGGEIVVSEFYSTAAGAGDYRTSLTKIKAAQDKVDAIIFQQVLNTIEPMFKQMSDLGLTKPLIADFYTINNPAFKNLALANGIEFVDYEYAKTDKSTDSARVKEFKKKYRELYNSDPTYFVASTFDSINLIAEAIEKEGEDPAKVGAYISRLKGYQGITGTLSFNNDCEVDRKISVSKVENGKIVVAE